MRTGDIFGRGQGEPAEPDSYGEPPGGFRLPAGTRLGPVHLQVSSLERSQAYYEEVLGMRVLERSGNRVALGAAAGATPLLLLHEAGGARPAGRRARLGLYHFAILLPDRPSLGRFVRHLREKGVQAGAGDHLVSEAFYLNDPDGLGIEVYADRPRSGWRRIGRELMMATDSVDVQGLLAAAGAAPWDGMPADTVIGHIHLHVGDLAEAAAFYGEALGFDRTAWSYPGALFFGADGYHHHVGTNTWAGRGAEPAGPEDARLLEWTLELPSAAALAEVADSLSAGGYPAEQSSARELASRDPWGTHVRIRVGAGAAAG